MTTQRQILFLTSRSPRHQQAAINAAPAGCTVVMLRRPSHAEVLQRLPAAEFLITERAGVINEEMIAAGTNLRLIQRLGSLSHDIDLDAAQRAGIPVCTWPVRGCVQVAEHMLMQILALLKRLPDAMAIANQAGDWDAPSRRTDENVFAYNWSQRTGLEGLGGKSAGILGFGEIGAELARRLAGFAPASVLYHKRTRLPAPVEAELGITYADPHTVVAASDVLCSLLPYTPETDLWLNAERLATMRPGAFLVSCGSGSIIDEAALAATLRAGRLAGAGLDTFEWEPLRDDNPLVALARNPAMNVLLTPHTAAGSGGSRDDDYANVRRILSGEALLNRVA